MREGKQTYQTRATPGVGSSNFNLELEDMNLKRIRRKQAIKTPKTSAIASLAEAPDERKNPKWSASSLAAPARREREEARKRERLRSKCNEDREMRREKRRVREKQKRTWYTLSVDVHKSSLSSIDIQHPTIASLRPTQLDYWSVNLEILQNNDCVFNLN